MDSSSYPAPQRQGLERSWKAGRGTAAMTFLSSPPSRGPALRTYPEQGGLCRTRRSWFSSNCIFENLLIPQALLLLVIGKMPKTKFWK